jgi:hypothetical protein
MNNNQVNKNILQNKELQRLHKEMTRYGMSEGGMEARVQMMSEEGRAYHRALKMKKWSKIRNLESEMRNTAGNRWRYLIEAQLNGSRATKQGVHHEEHHRSHRDHSTV